MNKLFSRRYSKSMSVISWFKRWVLMRFSMDFIARYNMYLGMYRWPVSRDVLGGVYGERRVADDNLKSFVVVSAIVVPLTMSIVILGWSHILLSFYTFGALFLHPALFNPLGGIAVFELVSFILSIFAFFLSRGIIKNRAVLIYSWTHDDDDFSPMFLQNLIMAERDVDVSLKIRNKRERVVMAGENSGNGEYQNVDPSIGISDAIIKR